AGRLEEAPSRSARLPGFAVWVVGHGSRLPATGGRPSKFAAEARLPAGRSTPRDSVSPPYYARMRRPRYRHERLRYRIARNNNRRASCNGTVERQPARERAGAETRDHRPPPRDRLAHGGAGSGGLVRPAGRRDRRPGAEGDPRPQPRRGEGARGHDARVASPARRRLERAAPQLPLHREAGARGGGIPGGRGCRRRRAGRRRGRRRLARHRRPAEREAMNDLFRPLAPVSAQAWAEIEQEAKRTLKDMLAARKLVDFDGPRGWDFSSVGFGRTECVEGPSP